MPTSCLLAPQGRLQRVMSQLLAQLVGAVREALGRFKAAAEVDALRKASPGTRTKIDFVVAVLATLLLVALVLAPIALGWLALWHTTLHEIGMFRDIVGLNKETKQAQKLRSKEEFEDIRRQIREQHGAPSFSLHGRGDAGDDDYGDDSYNG